MQWIIILIVRFRLTFRRSLACSRIQCAQKDLLQRRAGSRRRTKLSRFHGFQTNIVIDCKGISGLIGNRGGQLKQRSLARSNTLKETRKIPSERTLTPAEREEIWQYTSSTWMMPIATTIGHMKEPRDKSTASAYPSTGDPHGCIFSP